MCHRTIASRDPLIDRSRLSSRQPLSDSAGNIKCPPVLESNGSFHDTKVSLPILDKKTLCARSDHPCVNCEVGYGANCIYQTQSQGLGYDLGYGMGMENGEYSTGVEQDPQFITLPSQRSGRKRRKAGRRRNPIADSSQYQAYRSRQTKDAGDAKWSDVLEDLFLDALMDIPVMGRRKFSFNSKPHGRNELISEYLWIGYKRSLPKGVTPDDTMKRTRKQVSSHIQVLKGFMKDSPSYSLIFPSKVAAANGFEDSFRDNTTLKALAEGRLPTDDYDHDDRDENSPPLLKPASFEMFVSAPVLSSESEYHDYHGPIRIHDYSSLSSPPLNGSRQSIDTIRSKFPGELAKLEATNSLPPCIIHMNVGMSLMKERPNGVDLNTRVFLNVINPPSSQMTWRTLTTLSKPKILSGDPDIDPHIYQKIDVADFITDDDGTIKVQPAFPALPWAHAFIALLDLHDDSLLERITVYQEISSSTNNQPFIRRALLLWTFHKSHSLEGETTWRYITPNHLPPSPPSRHEVFSSGVDEPQPHNHHSIHSVLQDNFYSTWDDTSHLVPQNHIPQDLIDPFTQSYNDTHLSQPQPQSQASILHSPIHTLNFNGISVHPTPHFPYYQHHDTSSHLPDNACMSQESDNTMSTNTLVNFDTHHGLDIQLSYDGVGVGGLDVDDFGDSQGWLETPTRVGGVGVDEAFGAEGVGVGEAWGYDEQGGLDVGHGGWGDEQADLGVGAFGGQHHIQGGNIYVGTN